MRSAPRAALAALSFLSACGGRPPPTARRPTPAAPKAAESGLSLPPGVPDAPVGHQLGWVLDVVNRRQGRVRVAELQEHFHGLFLAEVPADKTAGVFYQLGQSFAPLTISSVAVDAPGRLVARATSAKGPVRILIGVEPASGRIETLSLQPDLETGPPPASFAEVLARINRLAPLAQLLVAEVDVAAGRCHPLHGVNADVSLAIGSTFKLYVLLALSDLVAQGKLAWHTPLAIRDEWKSLPSGTLQDEPAGKTFPLRTFAEQMISISDNTATDHLLYTIGRTQVEAALKEARHHDLGQNVPFLSTRELFLFRLSLAADEVDRYLALTPPGRRAYLDKTLAARKVGLADAEGWKTPRRIDRLEWFASATDLCHVMAALSGRAQASPNGGPLLELLAKNPGLPLARERWPYLGFKGGSEPGVLNLTWLARRDDDRWFVVSLGLNDPEKPVDEAKVLALVPAIFDLLAKERSGKKGAAFGVRGLPTPPAGDLASLERTRDRFIVRAARAGLKLTFTPSVREWTRPSLISWRDEAKAVAVPRWEELGAKQKQAIEEIAGSADAGPALFGWLFRWFFVPHELTHALQTSLRSRDDHAARERLANDMAIAFYMEEPGGPAQLDALARILGEVVARLPALPADGDAYFNAHYHELAEDPRLYGSFQLRFVQDGLRQRRDLRFDALATKLARSGRK